MCGMAGLHGWDLGRAELQRALEQMCASIAHRGPDDRGTMVADSIGLGMTRLSIIDLAGGHQATYNEDGTVAVVFNGEIYNYRELRDQLQRKGHRFSTRSDTEVIVHAYEDDDDECVTRFNGIFAFALWDFERRRLLMSRDRAGVKPLYYVQRGEGLAFASEIKALLTLPGVDRSADLEATAEFLRLGFVQAPRTLFRGIRKLPAGWRLVAEGGKVRTEPYWDLSFDKQRPWPSFEACRAELVTLLREAVRDQMISDVPLGAFLSGGIDSTAVVAFMREAARGGVAAAAMAAGGGNARGPEAPRRPRHRAGQPRTLRQGVVAARAPAARAAIPRAGLDSVVRAGRVAAGRDGVLRQSGGGLLRGVRAGARSGSDRRAPVRGREDGASGEPAPAHRQDGHGDVARGPG